MASPINFAFFDSSYMAEKNRKLRDQFETDASTSSADGRGIFRGISIFVDGFTIPSSQVCLNFLILTIMLSACFVFPLSTS